MSTGGQLECQGCERVFVSDGTPLGEAGFCLFCRNGVPTVCSRCGTSCIGRFDGLELCPECRSGRLGEQQYEDKQRALMSPP